MIKIQEIEESIIDKNKKSFISKSKIKNERDSKNIYTDYYLIRHSQLNQLLSR